MRWRDKKNPPVALRRQPPLGKGALIIKGAVYIMKATGIVRRIDDLGRVVIPKEIRRTMRIREGDPSLTTLTPFDKFCFAIHSVVERYKAR